MKKLGHCFDSLLSYGEVKVLSGGQGYFERQQLELLINSASMTNFIGGAVNNQESDVVKEENFQSR